MNLAELLTLCRKHLAAAQMESSARLCLADAVALHDAGDFQAAKQRALRSLKFSVGVFHPDFRRAAT